MKQDKPFIKGKQKEGRDKEGKFIKGEYKGGPGRSVGSISITTEIKKRLELISKDKDKKQELEKLIDVILDKAIKEKDERMIKHIWNYIDGMPRQSMELEHKGELPFKIIVEKDDGKTDK